MLSILNKLTLQNKLLNFVTNYAFWDKKKNYKTTTTKHISNIKKPLTEPGIEPGAYRTQSGCVTSSPRMFNLFEG